MKKIFFTLSLLFSVFLSACNVSQNSPTEIIPPKNIVDSPDVITRDTINIGVVIPLSGNASAYGLEMQKVLEYQKDQINIDSKYVFNFIYEDGKCTGNDAVSAFQKLTDIDNVKFIIGGLCSSETLAMAPLASAKNVLLISPASSNPSINDLNDNVFSYSYSDELVGKALADEIQSFQKVAIINEQNDFNIGIRDVVLGYTQNKESLIVANETFSKGESDFRNMLEKIAQAEPDAVILNANIGITAETLLRQAAEIPSWKNYQLISQVSYLSDESRLSVGDFAEGMIIIDAPNLQSDLLQSVLQSIVLEKGTLNTLGTYYSASTLDTINILTQLLSDFSDNDVLAIKEALRNNVFHGYISNEIYFGDKNFVQNIEAGKYIIQSGVAVYQ